MEIDEIDWVCNAYRLSFDGYLRTECIILKEFGISFWCFIDANTAFAVEVVDSTFVGISKDTVCVIDVFKIGGNRFVFIGVILAGEAHKRFFDVAVCAIVCDSEDFVEVTVPAAREEGQRGQEKHRAVISFASNFLWCKIVDG